MRADALVLQQEYFMKKQNPFSLLTRFEWALWLSSLTITVVSFFALGNDDYLTLCASLIGATALIFTAKGHVLGQVLIIVFAVFYGFISYHFRYYGEMITYLGMSAPIAVASLISWMRHPFKESDEVEVAHVSRGQLLPLLVATVFVSTAFYFILGALGNANLLVSTVSVTTSFIAASLTFLRSPYYALAYATNDVVLIFLWVFASIADASYIPMVICFAMFLVNDLYGFHNWLKMEKKQKIS